MSTDENNDAKQDNQEEKDRDGDEKSDVFDSNNPPGDMWMVSNVSPSVGVSITCDVKSINYNIVFTF